MSAETLRRASAEIRSEWGSKRGTAWVREQAFHLAVADLLDAFADRAAAIASTIASERVGQSVVANSLTGYAQAHAIARAYLGADA